MILLLTNRTDIHPNPVIPKIKSLGGEVFRLNTDDLLRSNKISSIPDKGIWMIENTKTGLKVNSKDVCSVWERRPSQPLTPRRGSLDERDQHDDLIEQEAAEFVLWFRYSLSSATWLGHPIYDRWAGSKIHQLQVAKQLGSIVPRTFIGNSFSEFKNWKREGRSLVVKPLDADCMEIGGEEYCFFSRKIDPQDAPNIDNEVFDNTINYIQEYVEKLRELRVTVVGQDVFTCVIDSQSMKENQGREDWRQGYDHGIKHYAIETPPWIKNFCLKYLKHLKLNFGCFDFIETEAHEYVFLECNPNGQWMWIEEETGLKISDSIAKFLVDADHSKG